MMDNPNSKEWITAIEGGNINSIDSLIEAKTDFTLLQSDDVGYWNIKFSQIRNNTLGRIYYYCLNKNRDYSNSKHLLEYYQNANRINLEYKKGNTSQIFGEDIYILNADTTKNDKEEFDLEIKQLDSITKAINNNLKILHHIILKRKNIKENEAQRIIYAAGADEGDWSIEPLSFLYFYENIYPHSELFSGEVNVENFNPIRIFRSYVAVDRPNKDVLTYLLSNINKKEIEELLPELYPERETDEWDRELSETIPSYKVEVMLTARYPGISAYSGHNLLHAAIVNVDLDLVKELTSTRLMREKTSPIHSYFYSTYGDKPMLPVELAIYKERQWVGEYNSDKSNQRLPQKFRLQQLRKIINYLKYRDENYSSILF